MATASGLKNKDKVRMAVIEKVNLETPNDERDPRHLDMPLSAMVDFPYQKTRSGALQGRHMPWNCRKTQQNYSIIGGISLLIALFGKRV